MGNLYYYAFKLRPDMIRKLKGVLSLLKVNMKYREIEVD